MEIDRISYVLLHPLDPLNTRKEKLLSVIGNIALSILTCGAYLAFWAIVRYHETPQYGEKRLPLVIYRPGLDDRIRWVPVAA